MVSATVVVTVIVCNFRGPTMAEPKEKLKRHRHPHNPLLVLRFAIAHVCLGGEARVTARVKALLQRGKTVTDCSYSGRMGRNGGRTAKKTGIASSA